MSRHPQTAALRVSLDFTGAEVLIGLVGGIDEQRALELAAVFDTLFDRGHLALAVDLSRLGLVDERALTVIARAARRLQSRVGGLTLRDPSEEVSQALDRAGVSSLVERREPGEPRLGLEQAVPGGAPGGADVLAGLRRDGPVAILPVARGVLDDALRLIVNLARSSVGGADGASVSLLREGRIMTAAASDETILEMDAGQYSTGEGPCLAASSEGRWFHSRSLETEDRWPAFVPMARELGIRSILSNPLKAGARPVGALNIYSRSAAAFGLDEERLAAVFAEEASVVLARFGLGAPEELLGGRLKGALRSREVIAQAQGVLMERWRIDETAAFDQLRRSSQGDGRPLRERAEEILASTGGPDEPEGSS